MGTRATVWIKSEKNNNSYFIFHHWDGYGLDAGIDPILKKLTDEEWNMPSYIVNEILQIDDDYRVTDYGVCWDSEYVYVIDVDTKTMKKYGCGINDTNNGDRSDEKTQDKYLENTYKYEKKEENVTLSPLASKLKEIVNSYDEEKAMTDEGAEFYAKQLLSVIKEGGEDVSEKSDAIEFDRPTKMQVLKIQLIQIVKYACKFLDGLELSEKEIDQVQRIFKIINEKD